MSKRVRFAKMSGSGNDFVLIDNREGRVPPGEMAEWARKLCRRGLSVGADGIIFLEPAEGVDFRWRFFNADGSEAEMCGNGGRCAARYAHELGMAPADLRFETLAGIIEAEVRGARVKLLLPLPRSIRLDLELVVDGARRRLHSIEAGVPHAVEFVQDLESFDVAGVGRAIRHHEAFLPAGTNADFARVEGRGRVSLRT
ncbi:MAG: diaminopimelate epimerase, partial [Nitrospinota bacterium]